MLDFDYICIAQGGQAARYTASTSRRRPVATFSRLRETFLSHGIPLVWNVGPPFGAQIFFVLRNRFINIYIMDKHFMLKNIMFARTHVTHGVDRDLLVHPWGPPPDGAPACPLQMDGIPCTKSPPSLRLRMGRHIAIS